MQTVYVIIGENGTGKTFFAKALEQAIRSNTPVWPDIRIIDVDCEARFKDRFTEVAKDGKSNNVIIVCSHGYYVTKKDIMGVLKRPVNENVPVVYTLAVTRQP